MKKFTFFIVAFSLAITLSAQVPQSFRYQAVARDNSGNVLFNQDVSFRISILSGSISGTTAYSETHTGISTNAFGLVELEIGKGNPVSGNFSSIDWRSSSYFVKIEMDPAGGSAFQVLSTSQLLSVPYALHSKTVESGDNWGNQSISSDATLTGNGTSLTPLKIADNAINSDKIQDGSVRSVDLAVSAVTTEKIENNAVSIVKLPPGATKDKYLRGDGSWATPSTGIIAEDDPTWSGIPNDTSDIGRIGNVGIGTITPAAKLHLQDTAIGRGNVVFVGKTHNNPGNPSVSGGGTRMMWYPDKSAFRAGSVGATEWDEQNIGYYSTATGVGTIASGLGAFATGYVARATSDYSTAIGFNVIASGFGSKAMGYNINVPGWYSTAIGTFIHASGSNSTALGYNVEISGLGSTAIGNDIKAIGNYSTSIGTGVTAKALYSTAIGIYNIGSGNEDKWVSIDPLFEIGNGTIDLPSNAVTVLKNGYVGFGTATPYAGLHIKANSWPGSYIYLEANTGSDTGVRLYEGTTHKWEIYNNAATNGLQIRNSAAQTAVFVKQSNSFVGIGTTSPTYTLDVAGAVNIIKGLSGSALFCNDDQAIWYNGTYFSWGYEATYNYFARKVTIGNAANPAHMLYVQGTAYATGSWNSSDIRFKKNISTIENALSGLLKLNGATFEYRKDEFKDYHFDEGPQFGFIAQELENIFPEVVKTESDGYKSVNYNGMIPVMVEAIKEQQKIINELKYVNENLKKNDDQFEAVLKQLRFENETILTRLKKIEALIDYDAMK